MDVLKCINERVAEGKINSEDITHIKQIIQQPVITDIFNMTDMNISGLRQLFSDLDFIKHLIHNLGNVDNFVSYSSERAVIALFQATNQSNLVTDIFWAFLLEDEERMISFLNVAVKILSSNFKNQESQILFFNKMAENWDFIVNLFLRTSIYLTRLKFLILCRKTYKIVNRNMHLFSRNSGCGSSTKNVNICAVLKFPWLYIENIIDILYVNTGNRILCGSVLSLLLNYVQYSIKDNLWKLQSNMLRDVHQDQGFDSTNVSLSSTKKRPKIKYPQVETSPECYSCIDRTDCPSDIVIQRIISMCREGRFHNLPFHLGFIGFGGPELQNGGFQSNSDLHMLRKVCLLLFTCFSVKEDCVVDCIEQVFQLLKLHLKTCESFQSCLFRIFADQDDELVECLILLLTIYSNMKRYSTGEVVKKLNPHHVFLRFLALTTFDHSVLLDLITSPETKFLEYLVKYLHCVISDWNYFVQSQKTFHLMESKVYTTDSTDSDIHKDITNTVVDGIISSEIIDADFKEVGESFTGDDLQVTAAHLCENQVLNWNCGKDIQPFKKFKIDSENDDTNINIHESCMDSDVASAKLYIPSLCILRDYDSSTSSDATSDSNDRDENGTQNGVSSSENCADESMSVLIRIRLTLEKLQAAALLGFNTLPLLKLLEKCEDLYEDM